MTTETTTTETTEVGARKGSPANEPLEQVPTDETPADDEETGNEAAKYRRRLRDTEGERDTLRGQVEALQRAEIERIAERTVKVGASIWPVGVELADLVDDTGNVDEAKVEAAAKVARDEHGLAEPRRGNVAPLEGKVANYPQPASGFSDSLT